MNQREAWNTLENALAHMGMVRHTLALLLESLEGDRGILPERIDPATEALNLCISVLADQLEAADQAVTALAGGGG